MAANTFGKIFTLTTFGESHGPAIGGIVDGCPAGVAFDGAFVHAELSRRRPGTMPYSSPRNEYDQVEVLSGVYEGYTLGTPIAFVIRNVDAKSEDYSHLREAYRPSHADAAYQIKYGRRDHRGGGRASARELAARVAGGAIAKMLLQHYGIKIRAWVSGIGPFTDPKLYTLDELEKSAAHSLNCPDASLAEEMNAYLEHLRLQGDSSGGIVSCRAEGLPAGWGSPVFQKIQADLAHACMGLNAAKGFEYGEGFHAAQLTGSQHNDEFTADAQGLPIPRTNHAGGLLGGITTGLPLYFRVAFKPPASIMKPQNSINQSGESVMLQPTGRHDVCFVPRVTVAVEAMTALVLADHLLYSRTAIV